MTNTPMVSKSKINSIRPEIAEKSLFEVITYMNALGWNFRLSHPKVENNPETFGYVSFKKRDNWHNRPILANRCEYGYTLTSTSFSEEELLATVKKAAELCLTVYETFYNIIPGNPNIYGEISPCLIANNPDKLSLTYEEFSTRQKEARLQRVYKSYMSGNIAVVQPSGMVITPESFKALESDYAYITEVFSGKVATGY